jgi:hypothetical protein
VTTLCDQKVAIDVRGFSIEILFNVYGFALNGFRFLEVVLYLMRYEFVTAVKVSIF